MSYKVKIDPEWVAQVFQDDTPFNLKNELKFVKKKYNLSIEEIFEYCADELEYELRPPIRSLITRNKEILILKIRMPDKNNNKGSSYGFRVVILKDNITHVGIVLSIFNKIDKKDLTQLEKNKLKKLAINYRNSK